MRGRHVGHLRRLHRHGLQCAASLADPARQQEGATAPSFARDVDPQAISPGSSYPDALELDGSARWHRAAAARHRRARPFGVARPRGPRAVSRPVSPEFVTRHRQGVCSQAAGSVDRSRLPQRRPRLVNTPLPPLRSVDLGRSFSARPFVEHPPALGDFLSPRTAGLHRLQACGIAQEAHSSGTGRRPRGPVANACRRCLPCASDQGTVHRLGYRPGGSSGSAWLRRTMRPSFRARTRPSVGLCLALRDLADAQRPHAGPEPSHGAWRVESDLRRCTPAVFDDLGGAAGGTIRCPASGAGPARQPSPPAV